jgi:hypothetical protein
MKRTKKKKLLAICGRVEQVLRDFIRTKGRMAYWMAPIVMHNSAYPGTFTRLRASKDIGPKKSG